MIKVCHISDTHGKHDEVRVNPCDILIHSGDCTNDIGQASLRNFLTWFERQPAKHKILIAGNHDGAFERWPELARNTVKEISPSTTYLQDSGTTIEGIKFWGSPVQPEFCNWHFNRKRGEDIRKHWDLIPSDVDVLVTHGPAWSICDISGFDNEHCGCRDLYEAILTKEPTHHLFGHIHHSYGRMNLFSDVGWKTECYNSSICNEAYRPINKPHEFEIPTPTQAV